MNDIVKAETDRIKLEANLAKPGIIHKHIIIIIITTIIICKFSIVLFPAKRAQLACSHTCT